MSGQTRSKKSYAQPDSVPPAPPPPAVGSLPFNPSIVPQGNKKELTQTPKRLPWDFFTGILARWSDPTEWTQFLLSTPGFEHDPNAEWTPRWPLGEGSQGRVALWTKTNSTGKIEDEVVVKQWMTLEKQDLYHPYVLHEVMVQGHLTAMRASETAINQLRGYKWYRDQENTQNDQARAYLQYAEYQTLQETYSRYRAWAKFLPEIFLWSTLSDLAAAAKMMATCPSTWNPFHPQDPIPEPYGQSEDSFILHSDIKPSNCFLARAPAHKRTLGLPTALVGDFGSARVRDNGTPAQLGTQWFDVGTSGFLPPEQSGYSAHWRKPLYGFKDGTFCFDEKTNIYGIGRVLYDLMTLDDPINFPMGQEYDYRDESEVNRRTEDGFERLFHEDGRHVISSENMKPRKHVQGQRPNTGPAAYSQALFDLVLECLRPAVEDRPSAEELLSAARAGYNEYLKGIRRSKRRRDTPEPETKVILTNTEMNELRTRGDAAMQMEFDIRMGSDVRLFMDARHMLDGARLGDPDEPPLQLPRELWHAFYDNPNIPPPPADGADQEDLVVVGARASWFKPVGDWAYINAPGRNPRPSAKRMREWDPADAVDNDWRQMLTELRNRTAAFAEDKPIALLEYILTNERQDVDATERILRWLYANSKEIPAWATKEKFINIAKQIYQLWRKKFPSKPKLSHRECLYFAATDNAGVSSAVSKLESLLEIHGGDDNNAEEDAQPPSNLALTDQIRLLRALIAHDALLVEDVLQSACNSDQFLTMILQRHNNDAHAAFDTMRQQDLLLASDETQQWMVDHDTIINIRSQTDRLRQQLLNNEALMTDDVEGQPPRTYASLWLQEQLFNAFWDVEAAVRTIVGDRRPPGQLTAAQQAQQEMRARAEQFREMVRQQQQQAEQYLQAQQALAQQVQASAAQAQPLAQAPPLMGPARPLDGVDEDYDAE